MTFLKNKYFIAIIILTLFVLGFVYFPVIAGIALGVVIAIPVILFGIWYLIMKSVWGNGTM